MTDTADFSKLLNGFDFLQSMVKNAGSAMPGISNWVTPTLDPEELDKRIQELKTVQFWLEQNAKMLGASIQGLEVQRMTLATLRAMNVQTSELAEAFRMKEQPGFDAAERTEPAASAESPAEEPEASPADADDDTPSGAEPAAALADPMKWWGSLTEQFGQLAQKALSDERLKEAMNLGAQFAQAAGSAQAAAKTSTKAAGKAGAGTSAAKSSKATRATKSSKSATTVKTSSAAKKATAKKAPTPATGKARR